MGDGPERPRLVHLLGDFALPLPVIRQGEWRRCLWHRLLRVTVRQDRDVLECPHRVDELGRHVTVVVPTSELLPTTLLGDERRRRGEPVDVGEIEARGVRGNLLDDFQEVNPEVVL